MTKSFEARDIFTQLEAATVDPVIERVYEKVREYQEILNAIDEPRREEIVEVVHELDSQWPYFDDTVRVTGKLHFIYPESDDQTVAGVDVISKGFDVYRNTIYKDGDEVGHRLSIMHLLAYRDSNGNLYRTVALPEDVAFEFPFDSSEARRNRLEYHHPELIEAIDAIVLNTPHEDESMMELRMVMIGDDYDSEAMNDIGGYLTDLLEFDPDVPYETVISGPVYVADDEGSLTPAAINAGAHPVLVGIDNIEIVSGIVEDEPGTGLIAINAQLLLADSTAPPKRVTIPLASIESIHSARRQVYEK